MADVNQGLIYKGHPLMRKDNIVYYGSMADKYIVILQILESRNFEDLSLATRVSVQLQLTDQSARPRDRIVKKTEKEGFYIALDLGAVWLSCYPIERSVNRIRTYLGIPETVTPLAIVPVGYPAESPAPKNKWKPENIHYNKW